MAEVVEIIVKLTDQVAPAAKKITKELTAVQKAGQGLKKGVGAGVKALSMIPAAAAGAAVALAAAKKAFDFAEQGAQIQQMGESWDFLMKKVGVSPGILDDLSKSARGTITEMQIMTSTATLLAGAGDELAKSMAEASPQLLEIAKAANKLNPSLGNTTFLYESIARGVKRASPLILDNLGIVIKIGDAYENFAKTLGKSAKELTTEERSMAVLNATLKAGDNLISQVGGTVDSVTDSFAQLTTISAEMANLFKTDLFNALGPTIVEMAEGAAEALEFGRATRELGLTGLEAARLIDEFGGSTEAARAKIIEMAKAQRKWFEEIDRNVIDGWAAATRGFASATGEAAEEARGLKASIVELSEASLGAIAMDEGLKLYNKAIEEGDTQKAAEIARQLERIGMDMLGMKQGQVAGSLAIAQLTADLGNAASSAEFAAFISALERMAVLSRLVRDVIPSGEDRPTRTTTRDTGIQETARGGPLTGINLVGEEGPELIVDGMVIPANKTRELLRMGLMPENRFARVADGGSRGVRRLAELDSLGGALSLGGTEGTTSVFDLPTSGLATATTDTAVSAAVQAAITATQGVAQETAAVVAAAISPQVVTQSQQILTMQARLAESNARSESLQAQMLEAIRELGTADDTGDAMAEAIQFLDA